MTGAILQIRIELKWIEPVIWRRVRIPARVTLGQLHQVIQVVMGWTNSHLHEFIIGGKHYGYDEPDWELAHKVIDETQVRLEVALAGRKTLTYLYDFGDSWEHKLKIEKILPAEPMRHAVCEAGENACPPEDVGGPPGYADFVHAILDPAHPEHREMLHWCGRRFDPRAFDINRVNQQLKRIKL